MGRLIATPGAIEAMQDTGDKPGTFLARHIRGNWGEVDGDDKRANDNAVLNMTRVLSACRTAKGLKLSIITVIPFSVPAAT
ncbi:MAG TPA: hypothetical protein VHP11_10165 [Tepidisphaeraceae bacterium]|nr:hypothetical protein [Tepidisphaeraceae bacterium]